MKVIPNFEMACRNGVVYQAFSLATDFSSLTLNASAWDFWGKSNRLLITSN